MKKLLVYAFGLMVVLFSSCEQKDLSWCPPEIEGNAPVHLVIHWEEAQIRANARSVSMPVQMTVYWYPMVGTPLIADMNSRGGSDYLARDVYQPILIPYNSNSTLDIRHIEQRNTYEVYNIAKTGLYNSQVPQLPGGETTVAEASPYQFWVAGKGYMHELGDSTVTIPDTLIDTRNIPMDSILTVHAYPKNVLREFTFLIYGVQGARWMQTRSGAISGQASSYFPATDELSQRPSTILFNRIEAIPNAQASTRWTAAEKELFAQKNPQWQSTDTLTGWTGDWITGKFATFGPVNLESGQFRLTVDALTASSRYYAASWGYYHGSWEDNVGAQIAAAMGEHGTWEEQLAWRQRNGGYDIVLDNEGRLIVPEEKQTESNGAFNVNVEGWGDMIGIDMSGGSGSGNNNTGSGSSSPAEKESVP